MAKVFLSYRRADPLPNWQVKTIGKQCADCGFTEVFLDRDTGAIPPGSNYRQEIEKAVRASDVVLVLIGEKWQALLDQKRDDPNDMVQFEIYLALKLSKRVVPLLLGGPMPALADLPESLREFHYCNGQSFEPDTMDSLLPLLLKGLSGESMATPTPVTQDPTLPNPLIENPLQDFAEKARQRAEEQEKRQQLLSERADDWNKQFEQFEELRQNPHLSFEEVREALQALCRHWGVDYPRNWDGHTELTSEWDAGKPAVTQNVNCEVVLENYGDNKIAVIKEVRNLVPRLGLADAKRLVESTPSTLQTDLKRDQALAIKKSLEACGAEVSIK